jgi:pyridoxine kinase
MEPLKKILSVQSHVVHGYVGNRAATFPLQCQGWDVDVINTVNFSNHTGYGSVKGTKTTREELRDLYEGLKKIDVTYDAFLTGYVPGAEALEAVCDIGSDLKRGNPQLIWLLDPVMGDEGELYVSESVIPMYRKILMRGDVDIITPNQFEAELLVDFKIDSIDTLKKALVELHTTFKVPNVAISSLIIGGSDKIRAVTSTYINGSLHQRLFEVSYIESYFTGVGDLFSALLVDRVHYYTKIDPSVSHLEDSVNEVLSIMATVLRATSEEAARALGKNVVTKMGSAETMKSCELRLVQCRDVYSSREKVFQSMAL